MKKLRWALSRPGRSIIFLMNYFVIGSAIVSKRGETRSVFDASFANKMETYILEKRRNKAVCRA